MVHLPERPYRDPTGNLGLELDDRREQNGKLTIAHSVFAVAEDSLVVELPGFRV